MSEPLLIILATLIYAAVHSWLASLGVKAWVRQHFGPLAMRGYRLFYNVFALLSGGPILALLYLLPDQQLYQIPLPWVFVTSLGQLAGISIIVVGILQTDPWHFIGLRQLLTAENTPPAVMKTDGPYNWVRHPLYTGGLILIWLIPAMTLNLLTIFIVLTIYLVVGGQARRETFDPRIWQAVRRVSATGAYAAPCAAPPFITAQGVDSR